MDLVRRSILILLVAMALVVAVGCQGSTPGTPTAAATTSTTKAAAATPVANAASAKQTPEASETKGVPKVAKQYAAAPEMKIDADKTYTAVMHTTMGDITFMLIPKEAPMTVNNFVFLVRDGFYDGVVFHRIIKGFMVQSGDPTGTGAGGPGYKFNDEPVTRKYVRGTLAMANAGKNTNGSQFFIVHQDAGLPPAYTIFGYATEGLDVLDKIANVPTRNNPATGEQNSQPTQEVKITGIDIIEK